jgi:hypothetical protein
MPVVETKSTHEVANDEVDPSESQDGSWLQLLTYAGWYPRNMAHAEKKLILKLDFMILTFGCLSFFTKYLDQQAITNAYVSYVPCPLLNPVRKELIDIQRHERRPSPNRQHAKLHNSRILGLVLYIDDTSLLLANAHADQHRAADPGSRLGAVHVRMCVGAEPGHDIRHAVLHRDLRVVLVHRRHLCYWFVVQAR